MSKNSEFVSTLPRDQLVVYRCPVFSVPPGTSSDLNGRVRFCWDDVSAGFVYVYITS